MNHHENATTIEINKEMYEDLKKFGEEEVLPKFNVSYGIGDGNFGNFVVSNSGSGISARMECVGEDDDSEYGFVGIYHSDDALPYCGFEFVFNEAFLVMSDDEGPVALNAEDFRRLKAISDAHFDDTDNCDEIVVRVPADVSEDQKKLLVERVHEVINEVLGGV